MSGNLDTNGQTQTLPDKTVLSLLDGGVMRRAYEAIRCRLEQVFPRGEGFGKFTWGIVPPVMSPDAWDRMVKETPFVGLGWVNWPAKGVQRPYKGDLAFALFLVTRNPRMDWQLIGDVASPGIFGMVSVALAALHRFTIPAIGTIEIHEAGGVWSEEWVRDDQATAALRIVIPGVQLDDAVAAASLPDLTQIGSAWTFTNAPGVTGVVTDELTLNGGNG